MKKKRDFSLSERLFSPLQLPEDLTGGTALVTLHGRSHLWIENFRGISSYSTEEICLMTRKEKLCVTGARLEIASYTKDRIEITGRIASIAFVTSD